MKSAAQAVSSSFAELILAAHLWQGTSNDCGPFSAAMLINAFTPTPVNPTCLAQEMDRFAWRGLFPVFRRFPAWATLPWGVADILRRNGVPAEWRPFGSPSRLIELLRTGCIPIVLVGSWRPVWGHVMVLLAWDPQKGWGFADPAHQTGEMHWIEADRFKKIWAAYGNLVVTACGYQR
jgi:hypothetical protein